jgi:hypothetical protein
MKDGLPLIGLILVKKNEEYRIEKLYVTCLNKLYLGIRHLTTRNMINYEISNFTAFISKNEFELPEKLQKEYQLG